MTAELVWFKRDLRIHDHLPLREAARSGPCVCLYVYELELTASEEFDGSHLDFVNRSLEDLRERLQALGGSLVLRSGEAVDVLERLFVTTPFRRIWSHEETGNALTDARDRRVAAWAKERGIEWVELPNHGVFRRLRSRDGWGGKWLRRMKVAETPPPESIQAAGGLEAGTLATPEALDVEPSRKHEAVPGGETQARAALRSFLEERGVNYRKDMSSPLTAWNGCSRLSPHLAWGNLSVRQVYQATFERVEELQDARAAGRELDRRWVPSLRAFEQRLRWHCHFMQKLEDEPEIEFENMCRAYDGLREDEFDEQRFDAWCAGCTGYPLVDACMRALHAGGWINFRMRAMLVSFASYHLWLHWRPTAVFLARHFLDFEPGIHFAQFQMQSGVTGINAIRIYSPIKQVKDQDPEGEFIKRYCPELARVPAERIAEPHRMTRVEQTKSGCIIGKDYPRPIVEHGVAYRTARSRMYAARGRASAREESRKVYEKHGSRRRPARRRKSS